MKINNNKILHVFYILTSVGVIIHELAHKIFAEDIGLHIQEVELFSLDGGSLGYVIHESPQTYRGWFAVSVAPFLVNSSLAIVCFSIIHAYIQKFGLSRISVWGGFGVLLMGWFAVATALHAFPSEKDIHNVENVKYEIWNSSTVPLIQDKFMDIFKTNIFSQIILSPLWVVIRVVQMVIYTIRSPLSVFTLPFVLFLKVCNKTRRYGSEFIYTIALAFTSTLYTDYTILIFNYINEIVSKNIF